MSLAQGITIQTFFSASSIQEWFQDLKNAGKGGSSGFARSEALLENETKLSYLYFSVGISAGNKLL